MMMAPLAAAMVASLMVPANSDGLVRVEDYPRFAIRDGRSGAVLTAMIVDPQGQVIRCTVLGSVGDKRFEAVPCRLASARKIRPARSSSGAPIHAALTDLILFVLSDTAEGHKMATQRRSADATMTVASLPNHAAKAVVDVALEIDPAGNIVACQGVGVDVQRSLVKAACASTVALGITTQVDAAGKPLAYVTQKRIAFLATAQAPH